MNSLKASFERQLQNERTLKIQVKIHAVCPRGGRRPLEALADAKANSKICVVCGGAIPGGLPFA